MRLPARFLTSTAQVRVQVKSPADALGQSTLRWMKDGPAIPCAHFPAGERVVREAQLRGVEVAREVYLQGSIPLDPLANRLDVDGVTYAVTLVREWHGFTVAGVTA